MMIGDLIASGRTADVYEWDSEYVLKLFHDWFEARDVEYEFQIAQAVTACGINSPSVKEMLLIDGRKGLIYERVDGISMQDAFWRSIWKIHWFARKLAEWQSQFHNKSYSGKLPFLKNKLEAQIYNTNALDSPTKNKLIHSLKSLPAGTSVCHGDYHPGNIILASKDAVIIDWIAASIGNPIADVARTSIILLGTSHLWKSNKLLKSALVEWFHFLYLKYYFQLNPENEREYKAWLPIVAGARTNENIPDLQPWLVRVVDHNFHE